MYTRIMDIRSTGAKDVDFNRRRTHHPRSEIRIAYPQSADRLASCTTIGSIATTTATGTRSAIISLFVPKASAISAPSMSKFMHILYILRKCQSSRSLHNANLLFSLQGFQQSNTHCRLVSLLISIIKKCRIQLG